MTKAVQSSRRPTNKLTVGSAVSSVIGVYAQPVVEEVWPQLVPAVLAGPSVTTAVAVLVSMLAGVLAAYWVPDAANVPVTE